MIAYPGMAEIVARVEQTLSRRVPAIAASLRSALTEFAPALRCHYPGQAGFLNADSKAHALVLLRSGDFLVWRNCLLDVGVERMRGLF